MGSGHHVEAEDGEGDEDGGGEDGLAELLSPVEDRVPMDQLRHSRLVGRRSF